MGQGQNQAVPQDQQKAPPPKVADTADTDMVAHIDPDNPGIKNYSANIVVAVANGIKSRRLKIPDKEASNGT